MKEQHHQRPLCSVFFSVFIFRICPHTNSIAPQSHFNVWFCAWHVVTFLQNKRERKLWWARQPPGFRCSKTLSLVIYNLFLSAICLSFPTTLIFCFFPSWACLLLDFIYVHPPSKLCDGFSAAMLNFTDRSTPQLRARLYDPAPSV